MTCEQALRLLAEYIDGELDEQDGAHVQEHLHRCRSCYSRGEFERRLKLQLEGLRSTAVSADLEQRIRGILHTFGNA
ncbi:MAG: anti-sigma factor family protein [Longimicrobiales bacterium]